MEEKLYVYHCPGVMEGHKYTDDVAICYAKNHEEACNKFKRYYSFCLSDVEEVDFAGKEIAILTSY